MTMGLFGLGPPEIAVILAVAGFVLGPTKLGELARDFGKVAGELKDVPKEFQQGLEEGEAETRKLRDADVPTEKVEAKLEMEETKVEAKEETKVRRSGLQQGHSRTHKVKWLVEGTFTHAWMAPLHG
jgi:sec-independent protein translocase protein TatA